ncbi:MAG: MATE family efflux transporter [Cellulosilyticum sp.]|nr:MATE family efflux transporter [Cellulosilyticum sp.]
MKTQTKENPLGTRPINQLLQQFAVPSIIAMLVSALYNIVDQFFIGRSVGALGNAATNVAFPLSISCVAIALLFGIGGASAFNLTMGQGKKDEAIHYVGTSATMLFGCGLVLLMITQLFLDPLLKLFGSPDNVLEYARTYTRITSIGFPFLIIATGGGHLIRADGSPRYTMVCNLIGAVINTILDAVFVFGFNMGMAGAALATIIGQFVSGAMAIHYLYHYKTAKITKDILIPRKKYVTKIMSLGAAPCINQLSMMIVQIVMNQSLTYYGALSVYGASVPLACVGIITKISQLFFAFIIGLSQGLQPIVSFNYGAKKYIRVKNAYLKAILYGFIMSFIAFLTFQVFPRQIITLFGNGSEEYYQFAIKYFRVFLFFTFANFCQPITSNFFTAIGKPKKGIFLSLTRQIIFFLPLLIILPMIMGIDGILYVGPIADCSAAIVCAIMILIELRKKEYNQTEPKLAPNTP